MTQPLHAEGAHVVGDELEAVHQRVSPAKYFAARRRMSRSCSSSRIRRCRASFSTSNALLGVCGAAGRRPRGLLPPPARPHFPTVSHLIPRSAPTAFIL